LSLGITINAKESPGVMHAHSRVMADSAIRIAVAPCPVLFPVDEHSLRLTRYIRLVRIIRVLGHYANLNSSKQYFSK
jgi:hypothetical protein